MQNLQYFCISIPVSYTHLDVYKRQDFMSGMKGLVGGELTAYTDMLNEARQIATKRMVDDAESMGADAVINVRYGSASMMQGAAEVIVYGTAVKYK